MEHLKTAGGSWKLPHKKRKTRKKRGSRTHGYGQVGQHRGGGQRGGHGKAGLRKHKWTHTIKYAPERLRKHGFKPPRRREVSVINVGEIDEQINRFLGNKQARKTKKGITVYLNRLGYDKLLGKGRVTHPLIVQVESCSKSASRKIEKAGGKTLTIKQ
jgi:large subunit ribosomal protein L15